MIPAGQPKVSVCVITYNHEAFIVQALESALMQRTDFPFEIVIGEDCSTDRTGEIVAAYGRTHPGVIRVLPTERNLGARANAARTLLACRGPYVAMLEGDDYWTDPEKLALQAGFLDANPVYFGCATLAQETGGSGGAKVYPESCPERVDLAYLLTVNPFHTCSVMYRKVFPPLPAWFGKLTIGDWPLHILHAIHGPFRLIRRVTAVYRVHGGGIYSAASSAERTEMWEPMTEFIGAAIRSTEPEVIRQVYNWDYVYAMRSLRRRDRRGSRAAIRRMASNVRHLGPRAWIQLGLVLIRTYLTRR